MLRQSTAERIKVFLTTSLGTPVTGLVATDFKGSNAFLYKSDGSKTTIALTLGGNLFEEDATDSPGIYALNLTTTHTNTLGSLTVSFQPSATAFTPTYFFDSVEADPGSIATNVSAIKAKTDNLPASPANETTLLAVKAKTDNLPATPADQTTSLAIKAKTDLIGTSTVANQSDVTSARDSIKGAQLLDISTIAGGALFAVGDDLHAIKAAIAGLGTGIAGQVWDELLSSHVISGTFGDLLNLMMALFTHRVRIDRATKKLTVYAADSITVTHSFDLKDINGVAADVNASERSKII